MKTQIVNGRNFFVERQKFHDEVRFENDLPKRIHPNLALTPEQNAAIRTQARNRDIGPWALVTELVQKGLTP